MRPRRGFYSIRSRLILWLLLPITLLGVVAIGITSSLITSQANKVFDRLLLGVAYSIEQRLVHRGGEVILNMPYFTLDVMESASSEKLFYRVQQQSGNLLAGFKGLPKPDNQTQEVQYYNTVFAGNDLRAVSLLISGESPQTTVEIIVAESLNGRQGFAENILVVLVLVSLLAMVLMLLAAIYAVHRGLLPLRRLSQRIEQRSEHDLRPLVSSVPKEVAPLVDSINYMMQRTRDNIEHIQQFNADVSHQLRTPLAEIKTLTQLARQESTGYGQEDLSSTEHSRQMERYQQIERFRQIEQITDFMSRTTQQLLSYAKTRQSLLDQQMLKPLDLIDFCRQLIMRHVPRIYRQGGEIEFEDFQTTSAWIEGDSVMLSGLLINLIDNALYYGALPGESPVIRVSVQVVPAQIEHGPPVNADPCGADKSGKGSVILVVEDQGPGIDPEQIDSVTSRFVRLDQQRQGSGLGLAIVRQICDFHSADLKLSNRSEARCGEQKQTASGLRVRICFPLAVKPATET